MSMTSDQAKKLREAADRLIDDDKWVRFAGIPSLMREAADTIEMLSEKARERKWIPCEERLPEEHEWIGTKKFGTTISDKVHITFDVNGERFVRTLSLQNGELSNYEKRNMDVLFEGWKMVAWMPLPEPWKGADDERQTT